MSNLFLFSIFNKRILRKNTDFHKKIYVERRDNKNACSGIFLGFQALNAHKNKLDIS